VILYYDMVITRRKRNARAPHSIGFMRYQFLLLEHSVVIYKKKKILMKSKNLLKKKS